MTPLQTHQAKILSIQRKKALGLKVTLTEAEYLHHHLASVNQKVRTSLSRDDDGNLRQSKTIEIDGVFDDVRERAAGLTRATRNKTGNLYLGSIDEVTARNWSKECGYGVGTAGFAEYAKRQLRSGNFNHFRADINKT